MSAKRKLLITGAGGRVGTALRQHLHDRYALRLLFHNHVPEVEDGVETIVSGLENYDRMLEAGEGIDTIVHLGIVTPKPEYTKNQYDQMIMVTNIRGTYNIYESARINKVPCVVFASSNRVTGCYENEGIVSRPDMPVRPDSMYGVSKVFGESMARHYYDQYGISSYCIRIANFPNTDVVDKVYEPGKNRWLSPRDMAELTACCIEAKRPGFGIIYGVSNGANLKWDLSSGKELVGWEPRDRGSPDA